MAEYPKRKRGEIKPGNVDLSRRASRPVWNPQENAWSTIWSTGVNLDGLETLLPRIPEDGRVLSEDEAINEYLRTGKHLGKYQSVQDANDAAQWLHWEQERMGEDLVSRALSGANLWELYYYNKRP